MDALSFLAKTTKSKRQQIYVLVGDEAFLKLQCRDAIRKMVIGDADLEFALSSYSGDKADLSEIRNDLDTLPFLAPARLVEVESADEFVTKFRPQLEKYFGKPSTVGVLVLDVKAFPETTRLAKELPDESKIVCKSLNESKLVDWCTKFAKLKGDKVLEGAAAELLLALVGTGMGMLASEIEKLSVAVGTKPKIEAADVHAFVGRSKAADVFKILNFIGEGKPADAIQSLSQLFEEGEDPLAILGPMTYQLRKLATIDRYMGEGLNLAAAMDAAKVPQWDMIRNSTKQQLKFLGRRRLGQFSEWLAELNFGLKGGNPLAETIQLERLVAQLARSR